MNPFNARIIVSALALNALLVPEAPAQTPPSPTPTLANVPYGKHARQVLDFYKCYRAYVRGKIHAFTAQDQAQGPEARDQALKTARAYFALAGEYAEAGERWAA